MPTTWTTITDPIGDTGPFDSRMIFGDFDGDGDIDILYQNGNTAGAGIGYMRNNGAGSFTNFTDAAAAGTPFSGVDFTGRQLTPANFFIHDFDGDGDLDILDRTSGATAFFRNDGGVFTRITDPVPDTGAFDQRMVWGDWDGDGDLDALYQNGNTAGAGIGYLRNDGGLAFTNFTNAASAGTPFTGVDFTGLQISTSTFVIDIDDDGDMDILDRGATQVMYRNDGGSFTRMADPLADIGAFDARMVIGDFDSDGDTDILYQNGNTAGAGFGYFRNDGGTFTNFTTLTGTPFESADFTGQQLTTWTVVDIDGDGDVDIVDRDQAGGGLVLYRQNGAPPVLVSSSPSDNGTGVAVGANIVLTFNESVSKGNGNIYIYRGDGTLIETISVGSAQVTGSGTTWTIDPSVTLAGLTNYYIRIDQETFADAEGAVFAGIHNNTQLNFTTQSTNTAPTFTNLNGDSVSFIEGTPARLDVGGNATVADAEQANFNGGTLTVSIAVGGVSAQDVLGVANIGTGAGQISVAGANISYQGVVIGTFTGGAGGASLVITLDSDATVAATQALVRALTYNNTSDAPNTASRTVTVSLTDGAGGTSATQTITVGVTATNDPHTGGAAITGTATEDQVLTAVSTIVDPDGIGTLHYQWQRNMGAGYFNVGGDQATYALGDADVGGVIRVVIYYTDAGGTVESATSAVTSPIANVNDPHTGGVSITGTATEDQVLTAVSTLADADGIGTLHYQWQRDTGSGYVNVGADQATYTLGDADVGGVVRVVVYYTDAHGTVESSTSAGTSPIVNVNDPHTGGVSITGTAAEDEVLTAVSTLADADGLGTLHYQWQRDTGSGYVNVGADQATYTLGQADVGGVIRVVVYYTDTHGTVESSTSAGTSPIADVDAPAVAVDDVAGTTEDVVLNDTVFTNDSDADGPALTVSAVNGVAADVGTQVTLASGALLTLNADGTYSYDPNGVFNHLAGPGSGGTNLTATDSFTYTLLNGNTATVTITITGVDSEGDVAVGDSSDNVLSGGDGDDTLIGGGGNDTLNGGGGSDTADYSGAASGVTVRLNGGVTQNDGDGGVDTLISIENITGSAFDDTIVGNNLDNILEGGDGYDVLAGLDGNDILIGGSGAPNQLIGGLGDDDYYVTANDTIIELLNQGHDRIFTTRDRLTLVANVEDLIYQGVANFTGTGNGLNNTIRGNIGDDTLYGAGGNDHLDGGDGVDTADYSRAAGSVSASLAAQTASADGDGGTDTLVNIENLIGSAFNDVLTGDAGVNVINGGAGDDHIRGGAGADVLRGGLGIDTVHYDDAASGVVVRLNLNRADEDGFGASDVLAGFENVVGSAHADTLIGSSEANVLNGGAGRDLLIGLDGNDILIGGDGAANEMYGGRGDDIYVVTANDTIIELAGEGIDTVQTTRNQFTLSANVENLVFTGVGNFAGTGNAQDNVITGGDGRDTLIGGAGNDTLNGGLGHDTARMSGLASEYLIEDLGGGQFRITDSVGGRDGIDILNSIEQVSFSDRILALNSNPVASPAKTSDAPQVLPNLSDDQHVLAKEADIPLIQPGVFDDLIATRPAFGSDMWVIDDRPSILDIDTDAHYGAPIPYDDPWQ